MAADGYCKTCGKYFPFLNTGGYCADCFSKHNREIERQRDAERRAEEDRKRQIFRDNIKTGAAVASATMLARQTQIMEEEQRRQAAERRAQAEAEIQENNEKLAQLNQEIKKYGFLDLNDYQYWANQAEQNASIEDIVKLKEQEKRYQAAQEELAAKRARNYNEVIEDASEEDKRIGRKLTKLTRKYNKDTSVIDMLLFIVLSIAFIVWLYKFFGRKFTIPVPRFLRFGRRNFRYFQLNSFPTFLFYMGIALNFLKFLVASKIEIMLHKIKKIKSKSNYPFFYFGDDIFRQKGEIYSLTTGPAKLGSVLILTTIIPNLIKVFVHIKWFNNTICVLTVFGVIGYIIFLFIKFGENMDNMDNIEYSQHIYYVKHKSFDKLGLFIEDLKRFEAWNKGTISNPTDNPEYSFLFLPRYKDEKFIEKYGKYSNSTFFSRDYIVENRKKAEATKASNERKGVLDFISKVSEKVSNGEAPTLYLVGKFNVDAATSNDIKQLIDLYYGSKHGDSNYMINANMGYIKESAGSGFIAEEDIYEKFYNLTDKFREKSYRLADKFDNVSTEGRNNILYHLNHLEGQYRDKTYDLGCKFR